MAEIRMVEHLRDLRRADWDACFADAVEGYHYLLAVENAQLAGFAFAYVTAWEGDVLLAAMPAFFTDYALDTTLQGTGKRITTAIASAFPNLLKVKLACVGSPCTEAALLGFHPQVADAQKPALLQAMIAAFEQLAQQRGCKLMGVKDVPDSMQPLWQPTMHARNYASLPGMPTASLAINFATVDAYLAQLSHATRKDMRRKLKVAEAVEIRVVHALGDVLPEVMAMYRDTRSRSDWQFEELTPGYFEGVLAGMPGQSFCTLYYANGQLLAANLMIHNGTTLVDKFFCMHSEEGRSYNLYFLSWFTNIRHCIAQGLAHYQSGQEGYENKLRLGSQLTRNHMFFKHRNALAQGLLKLVSPLLSADETLKEAA